MAQPVRVLLVVSSPLTSKVLERLLVASEDVDVVGIARRANEVPDVVRGMRPQLVCIDDAMPVLNALDITREVMRVQPCPILVVGASPDPQRRRALLDAGALDSIPRPDIGVAPDSHAAQSFITRLKMLSGVPVIGRRPSGQAPPAFPRPAPAVQTVAAPTRLRSVVPLAAPDKTGDRIIAIGASTGGPIAMMTILSALPASFPYPIVCVQHVSRGFLTGMLSWMDGGCRLRVGIAEPGRTASAGKILFPPEDRHLEIGPHGRISLSDGLPRDGHRPSATVLFESVAKSYGPRATAILLTGMGADGASGMSAVREVGGDTLAQDEDSCVVFGMPRVAIERGAVRYIGSPDDIARRLLLLC